MEDFQKNLEIHVNVHNCGLQVLCANLTSDLKGLCSVTNYTVLAHETHYCLHQVTYSITISKHAFQTYIHLF